MYSPRQRNPGFLAWGAYDTDAQYEGGDGQCRLPLHQTRALSPTTRSGQGHPVREQRRGQVAVARRTRPKLSGGR